MRIESITSYKVPYPVPVKQKRNIYYSAPVQFTGGVNIKKAENFAEKTKLFRQIEEILKENLPNIELSEAELFSKEMRFLSNCAKNLETIYAQAKTLSNFSLSANNINPQQVLNQANELRKLVRKVNIKIFNKDKSPVHIKDERMDYELVKKFKSALMEDNFYFSKIFREHYSDLKNIDTIKKLNKAYPSIVVPEKPEYVVAKKLENTLTRDFYVNLRNFASKKDEKSFNNLILSKVNELIEQNIRVKSEEEKEKLYLKVGKPLIKEITKKLEKTISNNSFSSIPEFRKVKKNLITDDDISMLSLNFDDFVTYVVREQYLNSKKPNEIVYKNGEKVFKVSKLKDPNYKFEKISSRLQSLVASGEKIRSKQRNYDRFTIQDYKNRIDFYTDRLDVSDDLLEHFIDFSYCKFEKDDIIMLQKLLKGADSLWDGEISAEELLNYVRTNNIHPIGTEILNKAEQQKALKIFRMEQQKHQVLLNEQKLFDNFIEILYKNEMGYSAELCSLYRPQNLGDINKSQSITKLIKEFLNNSETISDKDLLSKKLLRKTTYMEYSESEENKVIFEKAKEFSQKEYGFVDAEKAGQYILNSAIVKQYPDSLKFVQNPEILEIIVQKFGKDSDDAIKYLCKYEDYSNFTKEEKSVIENILNIFDIKNSNDKSILKYILENDYINLDTSKEVSMNDNKKIIATISSKAKKELNDYYKFPKSIEYFKAFEVALSQFATTKNTSGIKKLGKNNNLYKDVVELKIMGYPDRLINYEGKYYFDTFSNVGFH